MASRVLAHTVGRVTGQRSNVRVLMYHRVQAGGRPGASSAYLAPEWFRDQMAYVADQGLRCCRLSDLVREWPGVFDNGKVIVLTFDDAWASQHDTVLPVLKRFKMTGTFFVPTAHIDEFRHRPRFGDLTMFNVNLCSWSDIRALEEEGMEVGAHTHTHRSLAHLTERQVEEEVRLSRTLLEQQLQSPVTSFSYPLGRRGTFSKRTGALLRDNGFLAACTTVWGCPTAQTDPLELPRISIRGTDELKRFVRKLRGDYDYLRWRPT